MRLSIPEPRRLHECLFDALGLVDGRVGIGDHVKFVEGVRSVGKHGVQRDKRISLYTTTPHVTTAK